MENVINQFGFPRYMLVAQQKANARPHLAETEGKPCISVTTLAKAPKFVQLQKRHSVDIDLTSYVARNLGTGQSLWYEKYLAGNDEFIIEAELIHEFEDFILVGHNDVFDRVTGELWDTKTLSSYKDLENDSDDYWCQLQVYAWLFGKTGITVTAVGLGGGVRDYRPGEFIQAHKDAVDQYGNLTPEFVAAAKEHGINNLGLSKHAVPMAKTNLRPLLDPSVVEAWIRERAALHLAASQLEDDAIPACDEKQRWRTPTEYALVSGPTKRKLNNCGFKTKEEAEQQLLEFQRLGKSAELQIRPGVDKHCVSHNYCPYSKFCHYYKQTYGGGGGS